MFITSQRDKEGAKATHSLEAYIEKVLYLTYFLLAHLNCILNGMKDSPP